MKSKGKNKPKKPAVCKICKELEKRLNALESRQADLETEVAFLRTRLGAPERAAILWTGAERIDPPGPEWGA